LRVFLKKERKIMELNDDNMCFACGIDNPISLGLNFFLKEDGTVETEFIPQDVHQGYTNIMHGGLISTLLDESMAKVLSYKNIKALTAEIRVKFKKPVMIGQRVIITGILKKTHGKLLFTEALLKDNTGEILANAEGKFIKV
jgi:acyl-coenzyme A thioesterase PaaI-like protein